MVMNDYDDSPSLWDTLDNFSMQILGSALKNCVWKCLFISWQLMIKFLGNVAQQVTMAHVNEFKIREIFIVGQFLTLHCEFGHML